MPVFIGNHIQIDPSFPYCPHRIIILGCNNPAADTDVSPTGKQCCIFIRFNIHQAFDRDRIIQFIPILRCIFGSPISISLDGSKIHFKPSCRNSSTNDNRMFRFIIIIDNNMSSCLCLFAGRCTDIASIVIIRISRYRYFPRVINGNRSLTGRKNSRARPHRIPTTAVNRICFQIYIQIMPMHINSI